MASRVVDWIVNQKGNLADESKSAAGAMGTMAGAANIGAAAVAAIGTAALTAAVAYKQLVDDVTGSVDEINTLSAATGLSATNIKALQQGALAAGKDINAIIPKDLARKLLDVENGLSKSIRAFENVGFATEDLVGPDGSLRVTANQILPELIDKLNAIEEPGARAAAASQLLGENGKQMLSAFSSSQDFDRFIAQTSEFGINIGPNATAQTNAWMKATADLSLAFDDAKQSLFDALGPEAITQTVEAFSIAIVGTFVSLGIVIQEAIKWLVVFGKTFELTSKISNLTATKEDFKELSALSQDLKSDFTIFSEAAIEGLAQGQKFADLLTGGAEFVGPLPEDGGGGGPAAPDAPSAAAKAKEDINTQIGRLLNDAQLDLARTLGLTNEQFLDMGAGLESAGDDLLAFSDQMPELVAGLEELIAEVQKAGEDAAKKARFEKAQGTEQLAGDFMGAFQGGFADLSSTITSQFSSFAGGPWVALITAIINFARNVDDTVERFNEDILTLPDDLGNAIGRLMTEVTPNLIRAFPAFIADLMFNLPAAIVQGMVDAIPLTIQAFVDALKGVLFGGQGDGKPFTGKEGKVLGTSFKKGEESILGINFEAFAKGGTIDKTGLKLVHAGERIVPANGASTGTGRAGMGMGGMSIGTINIRANDPRQFLRELENSLGDFGIGDTFKPFEA